MKYTSLVMEEMEQGDVATEVARKTTASVQVVISHPPLTAENLTHKPSSRFHTLP